MRKKFDNLVANLPLDKEGKDFWLRNLNKLSDEYFQAFIFLKNNYPEDLSRATKILIEKERAVFTKNPEYFLKVLGEERKIFKTPWKDLSRK